MEKRREDKTRKSDELDENKSGMDTSIAYELRVGDDKAVAVPFNDLLLWGWRRREISLCPPVVGGRREAMDVLNGEKKRQPGHGGDGDDSDTGFTIEHKAYSRVGLLGNPSDVYYGRAISFTLGNFWATVRLRPSDSLIIKPHPSHDFVQFPSIESLVCCFFLTPSP